MPPDDGVQTLIVHDVGSLSPEEQQQLLAWLKSELRERPGCRDHGASASRVSRIGQVRAVAVLRVERRLHQASVLEDRQLTTRILL